MADQGICSRRKAEDLILAGKVKVNGKIVTKLGTKVDVERDAVEVLELNGKQDLRHKTEDYVYVILNKPTGFVTSTTSSQGESVMELLTPENNIRTGQRKISVRVYPVGRLDKDSEGLVLLTNDGELTNALTHPRYEHEKEYAVTIDNPLSPQAKKVLEHGMILDGEPVQGIKIIREFNKGRKTILSLILKEGKNRQIRKMLGRLGYTVINLRRVRMGKLTLGVLPIGKWKFISKKQIV